MFFNFPFIVFGESKIGREDLEGIWRLDHQICASDNKKSNDVRMIDYLTINISGDNLILRTHLVQKDCEVEFTSKFYVNEIDQSINTQGNVLTFTTCDGIEAGGEGRKLKFDLKWLDDGQIGLSFNVGKHSDNSIFNECNDSTSDILAIFTQLQML